MDLNTLLAMDASELPKKQFEAYKDHITGILSKVQRCIADGEYGAAGLMLADSPAGDGMGIDNRFIDFALPGAEDPVDLGEALDILEGLRAKLVEAKKVVISGKKAKA